MSDGPMWRETVNRPEDYVIGTDDTIVGHEDDGGEAFINLLFGTVPFEPESAPILIWNGASFEWVPDLSQIRESLQYQTRVTRFESGREQRRAKASGRRQWELRFQRGDIDAGEIWDFYIDRQGIVRGFWWRNPIDGQTYLVRFADQILSMDSMWGVLHRFGLRIVEVK